MEFISLAVKKKKKKSALLDGHLVGLLPSVGLREVPAL